MALPTSGKLSERELEELKKLKSVREALDRLKRRGIETDIAICPNCKSIRVIDLTSYHDLGYIGSFQPALYCLDCGWYGRTSLVMSNRAEPHAVLEDLYEAFSYLLEESLSIPDDEFHEFV